VRVTVQQVAELVQGEVHGDPDRPVGAARTLSEAGPEDIVFVENERHVRFLENCRARIALVPPSLIKRRAELATEGTPPFTLIAVPDPLTAFVAVMRHLHGEPEPPVHGLDPLASIHPSATVGAEPSIFPFAFIGAGSVLGARCRIHAGAVVGRNCQLGDDVVLHPHAVLYDGTVLGNRVIVHAGAVLGADGFGYRFQDGRHVKVPQFGRVEVGDDVEIGAGTTIDRGTFQPTRVGTGTKIDNLVMIGHNGQIGRHNLLVSQVGIAGSASTGDYVVIAGKAGVADHVHVGDRTVVGACTAVYQDVAPDKRMLGAPARPERETKRILLTLDRLPELARTVRRLEQRLDALDKPAEATPPEAA
jgi:UDP-3-O-[3-hydroxymyristoyl] glucosamine N-acyltransferase